MAIKYRSISQSTLPRLKENAPTPKMVKLGCTIVKNFSLYYDLGRVNHDLAELFFKIHPIVQGVLLTKVHFILYKCKMNPV